MVVAEMEITALLNQAFHQGPAVEANQLIDDLRQRVQAETGQAVNYEVTLAGREGAHLTQAVAPGLALYLREKGLGPRSPSVFISIFSADTLYFVGAADFFGFVQATLALDDEAFGAVLEMWERTGKAAAGLLPPPK